MCRDHPITNPRLLDVVPGRGWPFPRQCTQAGQPFSVRATAQPTLALSLRTLEVTWMLIIANGRVSDNCFRYPLLTLSTLSSSVCGKRRDDLQRLSLQGSIKTVCVLRISEVIWYCLPFLPRHFRCQPHTFLFFIFPCLFPSSKCCLFLLLEGLV